MAGRIAGSAINKTVFWPLIGAVVLPVLIGLFEPEAIRLVWQCFYWAAFYSVPVIIFGVVYMWAHSDEGFLAVLGKFVRPVPAGMIYNSDLKKAGTPAVTISLIVANTLLFLLTPEEVVDWLCFLPYSGDLSVPHVLLTTVTCAFFHSDFGHLFGNMVFLWAFGATLESRLGTGRYLAAYFLCSIISSLICLNLLVIQVMVYDEPLLLLQYWSIGASGVISGLMGLFVIRCYFARLSFSLPILFNPIFSVPVRINGIILIGFFFAKDLAGSVEQMADIEGMIDYWGHVGGFLGGIALALVFRLQDDGAGEAKEVKAERLSETVGGTTEASELYTTILETDPENLTALKHFIKLRRYNDDEEGAWFVKLLFATMKRDFQSGVRLVRDYYPKHLSLLSGDILFRVGVELYQYADYEKARLCLELAAGKNGPWQHKAMLILSRTYEAVDNPDRALVVLQELLAQGPEEIFRRQAMKRLMELQQQTNILSVSTSAA
ncbi:MAG: rhomboid family intramembrane serine protease [Desulfobacteraceae bacterium]|nr:rhomboid family intramembrane serine protease [Desulfobacteraceae bacterium]MBC2748828.1 rhomboid family intramembrane serine protease [Desulfobacteraceae bacterium]